MEEVLDDFKMRAQHDKSFEAMDPEVRAAAIRILSEEIDYKTAAEIHRLEALHGDQWWVSQNQTFGRSVRNLLRNGGILDAQSPTGKLEHCWVPIVEAAIGVRDFAHESKPVTPTLPAPPSTGLSEEVDDAFWTQLTEDLTSGDSDDQPEPISSNEVWEHYVRSRANEDAETVQTRGEGYSDDGFPPVEMMASTAPDHDFPQLLVQLQEAVARLDETVQAVHAADQVSSERAPASIEDTPDKFTCNDGDALLHATMTGADNKVYFVPFFRGGALWPWAKRLRLIWHILRYGRISDDQIVMDLQEARGLRNWINMAIDLKEDIPTESSN